MKGSIKFFLVVSLSLLAWCQGQDPCDIEATISCVAAADGTECNAIPPRNGDVTIDIDCEAADGTPCDTIPRSLVNCDEPITYTYEFCNAGTNDLTITVAEYLRDGQTVDLLPQIPVVDRVLAYTECLEVTEADTLDVCTEGEIETTLTGQAEPPFGLPCDDTAEYTINVPEVEPCSIGLDVTCTNDQGVPCDAIDGPPDNLCQSSPTEMRMRFNGGDCSQSVNVQDSFQCEDFNGGPVVGEGETSRIVATYEGTTYFDEVVPVGGTFVLFTGGSVISPGLNVDVYDASGGNLLQRVVFDSSCDENLLLKDQFGALQLVGFVSEDQGTVSCFQDVTFNYNITNNGGSQVVLTSLVSVINLVVFDLTDQVAGQSVGPGAPTFVVNQPVELDLCEQQLYTVDATVEGDDGACNNSTQLEFEAGTPAEPNVPTPEPTESPTLTPCEVEVEVSCVSNGVPCENLEPPANGNHLGELELRYTAEPCLESSNSQGVECTDSAKFPDDEAVEMYCVNPLGNKLSVSPAVVTQGESFALFGREGVLPYFVNCTCRSTYDATRYQNVIFGTSRNHLIVGEMYGGLQVERCVEQFCPVQVQYTYTIRNVGDTVLEVTLFHRTSNDEEPVDLLNLVSNDPQVSAGQATQVTEVVEINLCALTSYSTVVTVEAETPFGNTCAGEGDDQFSLTVPPTPAPVTPAPTDIPTAPTEPTAMPTDMSMTPAPSVPTSIPATSVPTTTTPAPSVPTSIPATSVPTTTTPAPSVPTTTTPATSVPTTTTPAPSVPTSTPAEPTAMPIDMSMTPAPSVPTTPTEPPTAMPIVMSMTPAPSVPTTPTEPPTAMPIDMSMTPAPSVLTTPAPSAPMTPVTGAPTSRPIHGGSGGDPHFITFKNKRYSFHGECDLVLLCSEDFGSGIGFCIHVRTKMSQIKGQHFSFISHVAILLGDDILEVTGSIFYINGGLNPELPSYLASHYMVYRHTEGVGTELERLVYKVELGNGGFVTITSYKQYLTVTIDADEADLWNSVGMLGTVQEGTLLARDGLTVLQDYDEVGMEWQVHPDDGALFQEFRAPQLPLEKCRMPPDTQRRRRLRATGDASFLEAAQKACLHRVEDYDLCMFDVLNTGDVGLAVVGEI